MTANILSTPTNLDLDQLKDAFFENIRLRLGVTSLTLSLIPNTMKPLTITQSRCIVSERRMPQ
jgi:hypothetical protein